MSDSNTGIPDKVITYKYKFKFKNGELREFVIRLDNKTLDLVPDKRGACPGWAELKNFRCSNCSIDDINVKYCPIALNLAELIDFFRSFISYEEVEVFIEADERNYYKNTTLQNGLSPLIGIFMVTAGCPIMDKLRPMVRFHLPFASIDETNYRVISMYILAQYFFLRRSKEPDWKMNNLVKIYEDVRKVNKNICKRLSKINVEDASINALIRLDLFADTVSFTVTENMLDEIEILFKAYLG
ncbi:MAG: hypothetical protein ABIA63_01250 [bacterium]